VKNPFHPIKHPNTWEAFEYAREVIEGKIPNCIFVVGACKRFIRDLEESEEKTFYFDVRKSERYLKHVQKFHHVKGKWNPPNIVYLPWQKFVFANIMGFIDKRTNERRFRMAHIEVPRGNGKSVLAGQSVLYFVGLDEEAVGNEISCIASKTDQAKIVLNNARNMAKKNKDYLAKTGVEVREHSIIQQSTNSIVRALSSDDKSLDGLTDILAILDELHAVPRDLFDVVTSGMKKRSDSLVLCITTAGFNKDNSGYSQSEYAKKICRGQIQDDTFFAIVYTIDENDDYFDLKSWRKANPCWGQSVDPIAFEAAFKKAKEIPGDLPGLLVKALNVWLNQAKSYFDMQKFEECKDESLKWEDFKHKKCFAGLDLASVDDLCVRAYVFKEKDEYVALTRTFVSEEAIERHKDRRDIYLEGVKSGALNVVPGAVVDLEDFQDGLLEDMKFFKVGKVLFDPYQATQLVQNCMKKAPSMEFLEFRQTLANFSEPTKKLNALILEKKFRWNGSPITRWCFGNTCVKPDPSGSVKPLKPDEAKKIDEVVAIVMALAPWLEEKSSTYETRGIRTV
jgi:phage terminase large subunit-like protein